MDFPFSLIIKIKFNGTFNHDNSPLFMNGIDIWERYNMYKQCQLIIELALSNHNYYSLSSSSFLLLSYTSLFSLYLDWKPDPRCKGDSTLQLWCRAWSM